MDASPPGPPAPPEGYQAGEPPPPVPLGDPAPGPTRPSRAVMVVIGVGLIAGVLTGVVLARRGNDDNGATGPVSIPSGWTAQTLSADGFKLGLPPGWKQIAPGEVDSALEELRGENPEIAELIESQLAGSLSNLVRFFAFDTRSPTLSEEFATNVNVVVEQLQVDVEFAQYLEANLSQLRQLPGVSVSLDDGNLSLPGGRAALIKSQFTLNAPSGPREIDVTQYLMLKGRRGFILSMTTTPAHAATYESLFEQIARTFQPL
ncbi:MAG: hypothetical protein ACRDJ1_13380 [Actinomycetota bacterium]